ncbi:MAG: ABC transporter ATP-binding protein [Candidatus Thorarchaeota archaeon]
MQNSNVILSCKGLSKNFGGLAAVSNLDFDIYEGEVLGLIGPNGAGKTTVFNLITGVLKADKGSVIFKGRDLLKMGANKITELGVGRTFQLIRAFEDMTVLDNVAIGGLFGRQKSHEDAREDGMRYLSFVDMDDCPDVRIKNLTPFDRKRAELASVLNTEPSLVLLDEFKAGLNEGELKNAIALTKRIRNELGKTIFWIEHVMKAIMTVAERIIVLDYGKKIAEGVPKDISKNPDVIAAYLGAEFVEESAESARSE